MKTTLKVSLLLTLFGTTLAVTTPVVATEEIPEICNLTIVGLEELVYDQNDCELLLTQQAQEIQDLLSQGTVVSQDLPPPYFGESTTQIINLITAFCVQLVDTHPNLGTDEVSAQRTCEQGMIWEVSQIVMANSPAGFLSNGAVWAPTWPDNYL